MLVAATVSLEASPEATELRPLLVAELGSAVVVEGTGSFVARVEQRGAALELVVREARGEPVLARRFTLGEGRAAALRSVVVAIAGAIGVEPLSAVGEPARPTEIGAGPTELSGAPASPAEPAAAPPLWLHLGAGLAGPPASPQLDLEAGAALGLGRRARVGVDAALQGLACCALAAPLTSGAEGLRSELTRVLVLATASLRVAEVGPLEVAVHGGAGALWQSMSTTPTGFFGAAPAQEVTDWSVVGRAAASLGGSLGPAALRWRLQAGADLHGALSTELPAGFPGRADAVDTGFVSPFVHLRVELRAL